MNKTAELKISNLNFSISLDKKILHQDQSIKCAETSKQYELNHNLTIARDSKSRQKALKKYAKEKIKEKVIEGSNNHKNAFGAVHPVLKLTIFAGLMLQSYYLWSVISIATHNDSLQAAPLDKAAFAVERGFSSFNGAGGFLHDVFGFLGSTTTLINTFSDPDKKRRWTMLFWTSIILLVIFPFVSYLFKFLQNAAKEHDSYFYICGEPIALVFSSFLMTMTAVWFGLAMRYWTDQVLKKALTDEEWVQYKDPNQNKVTLKEFAVRVAVGVPLGLVGSILFSYYKPILLEKLAKVISETSFIYKYTEFTLTAIVVLFGLHCVTLRTMMPAFIKLFNQFFLDKNRRNHPHKAQTIIGMTIMYFSGIGCFGLAAVLDKMQYFSNPIVQTLAYQGALFFAIFFNIIGATYIFKMMMLIVNAKKLCEGLLSHDNKIVHKTQSTILRYKTSGILLIISGIAMIASTIGLFIYSKVHNIGKLYNILENVYFIAPVILLFTCLIFAGIALNGRSGYIQNELKNGAIAKDINDAIDKIDDKTLAELFENLNENQLEPSASNSVRKTNNTTNTNSGIVNNIVEINESIEYTLHPNVLLKITNNYNQATQNQARQ
jgi:hypothetical protein